MKKILVALLSLISIKGFAGDLRCVSSERSEDTQIIIQGQANYGNILTVNVSNQGQTRLLEVQIEKIKPTNDFVEINGFARNMVFIGGGQMNMQILLPLSELQPAVLRTVTPMFNQNPLVNEVKMNCVIQNLYQPQPVSI